MATMAEMAGLKPVSMAEAAGLTPVTPDQPQIDTPQNQATIARRNREAAAAADFNKSVAEDRQPGIIARIGRGAEDIYQGVNQRVLQAFDALPKGPILPSIDEIRAYSSPEDQKLSDADLLDKFKSGREGVSQEYTNRVNNDLALYNKDREGQGTDVARVVGSGLALAPTMVAAGPGMLARAKLGAIGGGIGGAAQFTPSNKPSDTAVNTAVGAAGGAVAAPVLGYAGDKTVQGARWLAGRIAGLRAPELSEPDLIKAIPDAANLQPAQRADLLEEAQNQMRSTGALDADSLARKANLIAQGVTPTKSMVTRDPADWTRERNLQKLGQSPDASLSSVGQELTNVYQGNDRALSSKLGSFSENLPQATQEGHGMTVMQGLGDLANASQKDVSKVYDGIRAQQGNQLASDARNVVSTLTDPDIADNAYAEPIINSVTKRLKRLGMVDAEGQPTSNSMTVTQADEFRKFLQTLKNGDPKTDRIVGSFIKATDADVTSGFGSDVMSPARQAAQQRFATLENPATQKALNALGELNQGKTAQNFIKTQVIDAPAQDVGTLMDTIGKIGDPAQRAQAQNSLKAAVLQHFQSKAINPNSGKFSGASLSTAMREFGDAKGAQILGDDWAQLQNLARAGVDATYEPAYSAVNHSNSGTTLLSMIRGARAIPGVPLLITDNAEKIAERVAANGQLRDALGATAPGPAPNVPPAIEGIARLLPGSAASASPAINPMLNKRRERSN